MDKNRRQSSAANEAGARRAKGSNAHLADLSDVDPEWWRKLPESMSLSEPKSIPLREIAGSAVGCNSHFNADWTPNAWDSALQSLYDSISIGGYKPERDDAKYGSIRLFKIDGEYWVDNGHHRVAVVKMLHLKSVLARVWQDACG